jgi:predicted O-methyltransferase YrrM
MRDRPSSIFAYIESLLLPEGPQHQLARVAAQELGLAGISLSPVEGRLLQFLAQLRPRQKIVEIGTLTGLSTLYLLPALAAGGRLWTLEKSAEHYRRASDVLRDPVAHGQCEIVLGDARDSLLRLGSSGPFDFLFIDGNKAAYLDYWNWGVDHLALHGMIVVDNIFLSGAVWGDNPGQRFSEKQIRSVQSVNQRAFADERFRSMIIPTGEGLLVAEKIR